jgi:hypothetical protein
MGTTVMARSGTLERVASPALGRAERIVARALPSLADALFALCLFAFVFGLQGRALGTDGDIGWHIRLGLRTLGGDLPRTDTLSSTLYGRPMVATEWLAEVCFAAVWRLAGLNGVVAVAGVLAAATAGGLLLALRARGTPLLLALPLALLAIALTSIHWVARPHIFSLPLALWWSEWLWRYWRDGRRSRLWYFPAVMLLWVNLHTYFLYGLLMLGTATAVAWLFPRARGRAQPWPLTAALGLGLLATAATPWGLYWPGYFWGYFTDPLILAHTQELQSPDFHTLIGRVFLVLLFALAAAWIFGGRARARDADAADRLDCPATPGTPEPLAWATAGLWTALALTAVRGVPLWALTITPLLGEALTRWLQEIAAVSTPGNIPLTARLGRWVLAHSMRMDATERQMGRGLWTALALGAVGVVLLGGGRLPGGNQPVLAVQFSPREFPVAAVARLRQTGLPAGRGFNTLEWGGYLAYALPEYHVFIDSRGEFYGPALLGEYLTIVGAAPGWQHLLDRYHVRWALLPTWEPLASVLAASPTWSCRPLGGDQVAVLCVRSASRPP